MLKRNEKITSFANLFPTILYDKDQIPEKTLDIWNSFRLRIIPLRSSFQAFQEVRIRHTDTPEKLASRFYGSSDLWWIVLLSNDVEDPFSFIDDVLNNRNGFKNNKIKLVKKKYVGDMLISMKKNKNIENRNYREN